MTTQVNAWSAGRRRGFTLIELLIAMVMGVIVLAAAMKLAVGTVRNLAGTDLRDGIDRNARYIGASLQRDLSETGVGFDSDPDFGSLSVYGDTIAILHAPYRGDSAATGYSVTTKPMAGNGKGNCGNTCLRVSRGAAAPYPPFEIAVGDLIVLQFGTVRRLLLVQTITNAAGATADVTFYSGLNTLLNRPAGISSPAPGLALNSTATLQKLAPVVFFRDGASQLQRAITLTSAGAPAGQVLATGIQTFDASLFFTNGTEGTQAIGTTDGDSTNNYNKISTVRVQALLQAERTDTRINRGVLLTKNFEWRVAPRNLTYERNQ